MGKARPHTRFTERLATGHLDHITKGRVGVHLKLADQYGAMRHGDVARRLHVHRNIAALAATRHAVGVRHASPYYSVRHASHRYHHGRIGPHYKSGCFSFHYGGPSFFAGTCWYPTWHSWVNWSWHHHCLPVHDPRPVFCRPIVYKPCLHWTWYKTPTWVSLPEVASGTWVDVAPIEIATEADVQLLAVRFVDPGHPGEDLGPRFRVWFRNNSDQAVEQPFNVRLFAANDDRLVEDLPQAGVRVTAVDPGQTQSIDIRLPVKVSTMARDDEGTPAPFTTLHVVVDADQELSETSENNNGTQIAVTEILPVDPIAFEVDPQEAAAGGEMILAGEGLGPVPGQVLVHIAGLELDAEILGWYDLGIRFTLPELPLATATEAEIVVIRGDGAATNPLQVTINRPALSDDLQLVPPTKAGWEDYQ